MFKLILICLFIFNLVAQVFVPINFQSYQTPLTDTLSVFIKESNKFYHVANFTQESKLQITGKDTLLNRIQKFDAINSDLAFEYHVNLAKNMVPTKVELISSDSIETHLFSFYSINSVTRYLKMRKADLKQSLPIKEVIFEDNNIDVVLSRLIMKQDQTVKIPVFLTDDYKIEDVQITFKGFFELPINNQKFKAKMFEIKGSDFTDNYWLDIQTNALLQFESVDDNFYMIKQNFNPKFD